MFQPTAHSDPWNGEKEGEEIRTRSLFIVYFLLKIENILTLKDISPM